MATDTIATRKGCLLLAAFLMLTPFAWAQRYSDWRIYRAADGLAETPCVSVNLAINGRVLTKHFDSNAISELDGYVIRQFASPEIGRVRAYESSGGQLWMMALEGIHEFSDGAWQLHRIPEVAREFEGTAITSISPVAVHIVKQNRLFILLPDELLEYNLEDPGEPRTIILQTAGQTGLQKLLGMTVARDGSVWISGMHGLEHSAVAARNLKPGAAWQEYTAPGALDGESFQQPLEDIDGTGVTCTAESPSGEEYFAVHFDGQNWTSQSAGSQKLRGAWRGPEGATWAVTLSKVFQIDDSGTAAAEIEEVAAGHYFDVAVETNGIFWIASAEGLLRYSPPLWKPPRVIQRLSAAVPCLAEDSESRIWFTADDALHSLQDQRHQEYTFPRTFHPTLQNARALWSFKNGKLLLDAGERLFEFQPATGSLNALPSTATQKQHTLGAFRDGSVAVETTDNGACRYEKYDGAAFQPFPAAPPGCSYNCFLETQNGDLWLGGERGVVRYHERQWQTNEFAAGAIISLIETAGGKIWCATADAIWEFDGQSWTGVHGGFDQINSMIRSHDGNVWVASNGGVERFAQGAWIENSIAEGLPNAPARRIIEDRRGRIWVGTSRGLTLFHPEADQDAPRTHIRKQPEEDTLPQNTTVSMVFSGDDKWKYTPRDRLLYSFRLDQHDWAPFSELNWVSYSDLSPGSHALEVRAMDRNGNIEEQPARMTFAIALPWYLETRLVLISLASLLVAVFFAALAVNRHRQLLRSYAEVEKKVAERTRELEIASRELVHSQKMNALGTLAAGIAHDFNNILSIIKGSAQIIEDNVDNTDKVRTRVDRIKTMVEQGAGIVKAMLGFSAGSSDEPTLCDLNAIVRDTIQLLGDRFQRETAVLFKPEADVPPVPAVKEFVQQVLLNFIFNAAEAETATSRKQIILSLRRERQLPTSLALAPARAPEYVMISVLDFGCGIQPENLPRIFEPFFTTKAFSARRGTGLGLSMVYELARKLEAGLCVESIVDVGSTFTLILPVRDLTEKDKAVK